MRTLLLSLGCCLIGCTAPTASPAPSPPPKGAAAPAATAAPVSAPAEKFGELTVAEVNQRRMEKGFHLIDNNSKETWQEGHLPGARWVQYSSVTAADLPADKEATLVFYCANEH